MGLVGKMVKTHMTWIRHLVRILQYAVEINPTLIKTVKYTSLEVPSISEHILILMVIL